MLQRRLVENDILIEVIELYMPVTFHEKNILP